MNCASTRAPRQNDFAPTIRRFRVQTGSRDPAGWDIVVNATPLGMKEGDHKPFDVDRILSPDHIRR